MQIVDKFWRSNTQRSEYSQQYCIINVKFAKRLDLNCSQYRKEIIIMWPDRGARQHANHTAIYKHFEPTHCTP